MVGTVGTRHLSDVLLAAQICCTFRRTSFSSVQFSAISSALSWVFGLDFFGYYFISSIIIFKVQRYVIGCYLLSSIIAIIFKVKFSAISIYDLYRRAVVGVTSEMVTAGMVTTGKVTPGMVTKAHGVLAVVGETSEMVTAGMVTAGMVTKGMLYWPLWG